MKKSKTNEFVNFNFLYKKRFIINFKGYIIFYILNKSNQYHLYTVSSRITEYLLF